MGSSDMETKSLNKLRNAKNINDISRLLGYKPSAVSYILYQKSPDQKYSTFEIKKKSGGLRVINAPYPPLKQLQSRLASLLADILEEIDARPGAKPVLSHGFRRGHSIATNAAIHTRARHVLNVDIKDFFPSFNFGRVRGFFINSRLFKLNDTVATIIAQIACHKNELPQGAPTSPIITNLITHWLDNTLVKLAKRRNCIYSRYADDITFSTRQKEFPAELATWNGRAWAIGSELRMAVRRHGFDLNDSKTRLSSSKGRQTVTGLTVNRHANIRQTYYRATRAMVRELLSTGSYYMHPAGSYPRDREKRVSNRLINWLAGRAPAVYVPLAACLRLIMRFGSWARRLLALTSGGKGVSGGGEGRAQGGLDSLQGRLSHIYNIKSFSGRTKDNSGIDRMFESFLLYRKFYSADVPLLVCEGKTDNVYIRTAIMKLWNKFPNLTTIKDGSRRPSVKFYRHSGLHASVLDMKGGEGDMKKFISSYARKISRFSAPGLIKPIVFIVDNDDGGASVYKMVESAFGKKLDVKTGAGVTHLVENLYLVSTDPKGPSGMSCIEENFDAATLGVQLEGRRFKYLGATDKATEYGKNEFADRVVLAQQAAIDFAGFEPLLDRISKAISQHELAVAAKAPKVAASVAMAA